jgi:hypothetical protein
MFVKIYTKKNHNKKQFNFFSTFKKGGAKPTNFTKILNKIVSI